MLSDRDRGAGFQFYVRRTRQMIRMRVSFQDLFDFDSELLCFRKEGIGRLHGCLAAAVIEIKDGVDHRT
jgi:hypothetical protein